MHVPQRASLRPARLLPLLALGLALAGLLTMPAPVGAVPAVAAPARGCPSAAPAEVESIARRYFDAFNRGDAAALDALLAPGYRHQGAVVLEQDRDLHRERLLAVRSAFPDGVFTIDWLLVDGDTVTVRHTFRGTQHGEYVGIAATGRPVAVRAFHIHRVLCGQIVETWNAADTIGLFRQLGAIPGPLTTPPDQEPPAPASAVRASCPATTPAANAALARRWYDEALNQGQLAVLEEILAEDVVHHGALFVDYIGREAVGGTLRAIRGAFPDTQYTVEAVYAAEDRVVIRWSGRGTHLGEFLGIAPAGRAVTFSGINAFRVACGAIVEVWSEANGVEVLRQLGALP